MWPQMVHLYQAFCLGHRSLEEDGSEIEACCEYANPVGIQGADLDTAPAIIIVGVSVQIMIGCVRVSTQTYTSKKKR